MAFSFLEGGGSTPPPFGDMSPKRSIFFKPSLNYKYFYLRKSKIISISFIREAAKKGIDYMTLSLLELEHRELFFPTTKKYILQ